MIVNNKLLKRGYEVSESNIPSTLRPLLDEIITTYKECHDDIESVYVIGSLALGEFKDGISDIDIVGITEKPVQAQSNSRRTHRLVGIGDSWDGISFIDNSIIVKEELSLWTGPKSPVGEGATFKLAMTGICIWGKPLDFSSYAPTVSDVAYSRTERARTLMQKYRSNNLIEPFRKDERLLVRSCAKAAMRVVSGITILRGAEFYPSPYRTAEKVAYYAPEAAALTGTAMKIIDSPTVSTESSMAVAESTIRLFYDLFPEKEPSNITLRTA